MIASGRTIRQAITAGTAYEIRHASLLPYGYFPPAAETPAEVLACALRTFGSSVISPGTPFDVIHIIGGSIGCFYVEHLGIITA